MDSFKVMTPSDFLKVWREEHEKNRNVMTIRVPDELKERIEKFALLQGVSINQFALYTFTKELAELESNQLLKK